MKRFGKDNYLKGEYDMAWLAEHDRQTLTTPPAFILTVRARGTFKGRPIDNSFLINCPDRAEAERLAAAFRAPVAGRSYRYTVMIRKVKGD
jgi:hypothetical protein